jgi:hypothetical protein
MPAIGGAAPLLKAKGLSRPCQRSQARLAPTGGKIRPPERIKSHRGFPARITFQYLSKSLPAALRLLAVLTVYCLRRRALLENFCSSTSLLKAITRLV